MAIIPLSFVSGEYSTCVEYLWHWQRLKRWWWIQAVEIWFALTSTSWIYLEGIYKITVFIICRNRVEESLLSDCNLVSASQTLAGLAQKFFYTWGHILLENLGIELKTLRSLTRWQSIFLHSNPSQSFFIEMV